jgi:hypothetical protein
MMMGKRVYSTDSLSRAERDDAADRVVWRHTDGHAIAWNNFDAEAAHAATQLRENLMASVALDPIQPAGMHCNDCPLHINQIVFAQSAHPFLERSNECATRLACAQVQCFL